MTFHDFLISIGLIPRDISHGKWIRCSTVSHPRKKNGSYKLSDDGRIGWAQDFAIHESPLTWRADGDVDYKVDMTAINARRNEERRKAIQATHEARAYWMQCKPLRNGHPYLDNKKLTMRGCDQLRASTDGLLVVPIMIDNNIMSLQRINSEGEKRFWYGASAKGGYYEIGSKTASVTILCEGLATGLAIYQSVPNCRVIVAFNCGNMPTVANKLKLSGLCVVAADNDFLTEEKIGTNPGIKSGTEAAEIIGCGVAWPTGIAGSDYADMLLEFGESGAGKVKLSIMRGAKFIRHS